MFETLKRLYIQGRLTDEKLANAVKKEWVTQAEADEIRQSK